MKVLFISNYLTHHQLPFCQEMANRLGDDFIFIATNAMEAERVNMGWELDLRKFSFAYFYDDDKEKFEKLILDSEFVICGGTHFWYVERRVQAGKPTFRYFERLYKTGRLQAFKPGSYYRKLQEHTKYRKEPIYLLCAGAYVPADFHLFGAYPGKMLKWGYFPETREYEIQDLLSRKKKNEILWTGRMIDWKHPEEAVYVAKLLKKSEISFHLTMIGEGPMRDEVERLIAENELGENVTLLDFMQPEKVREYMEQSSIYLMTSDQQEGWGAVVNEAMNSGCVVIGSVSAGSVPYLIRNGQNGFYYVQGELGQLSGMIKLALGNDSKRENMAVRAYETIHNEWNATVAVERFLQFCDGLEQKREAIFEDNILSKAEIITVGKNQKRFKD